MRAKVDPGRGALRVFRGGLLAVVCATLALAGHVHGGWGVPPLPVLLAVGLLIGVVFVLLADRRHGFVSVLGCAVVSQVVFHVGFTLDHASAFADASGPYGHDVLAALVIDPAMLSGHLLAAVMSAWLLVRGEDLLWSLIYLFALVWVPALGPVPIVVRLASADPTVPDLSPRSELLWARHRPRRGPPAFRLA